MSGCLAVNLTLTFSSVEGSSLTRAESRTRSLAVVLVLARLAFQFTRQQIDKVAALSRVLRGTDRKSPPGERQDRW